MNLREHGNIFGSTCVCLCCGSRLYDKDDLKGPYDLGPYRIVCEKCWSKPFLHFPDKEIRKDGLSYPPQTDEIQDTELQIWKGEFEKSKNNVLLVEPNYYTRYPPLGLLKLSSFHKLRGDSVELVRFPKRPKIKPDIIHVTSLFTYSWREVHEAVGYYKRLFPDAELVLGGIYVSLLPDHAMSSGADYVHVGLIKEVEILAPDYSLLRETGWDSNILFSSRGCIRRCGFCAVPKLEGSISARKSILPLICRSLRKIVLWDNNILATPNWRDIFSELEELEYDVDFNQGFDARLITQEVADKISRLKTRLIRLAFDNSRDRQAVSRAISFLLKAGVRKRKIVVYTLFNYTDTPSDFLDRVRQLLQWGVVSYPMRYEPLCSLIKNEFVSPKWNAKWLNLVQRARRVIGYAGSFPPYTPLIQKFCKARGFEEAFELRPSLEEIKRKLKPISEEEAKLVYAYYKIHDLTISNLPLEIALANIKKEKEELIRVSNEVNKTKEEKRLRGTLDWRWRFRS